MSTSVLHAKGTIATVRVQRLLRYGAEVQLEDGTPGIIRNRELRWGEEPRDPGEVLSVGQVVQALVLKMDEGRGRLELSLRQAERDPWRDIHSRYTVGQVVRGQVVRLWRGGAFVELEAAVDAFVPLEETQASPPERIEDVLWVGDTVEGILMRIDPASRRIALSLRERHYQIQKRQEEAEQRALLGTQPEDGARVAELLDPQSQAALVKVLQQCRAEECSSSGEPFHTETAIPELLRILLADDDPSFRGSLRRLLERIGYKVTAVESAEKALELSEAQRFDLALLDLGFPTGAMPGLQGAAEILKLENAPAVVVITGIAWLERNADALQQARQLGVRSALLKPVQLGRLEEVMRAISQGKDAWNLAQLPGAVGQGLEVPSGPRESPASAATLDSLLVAQLQALLKSTGAGTAVLFQAVAPSGEIGVRVHVGAPLKDYDKAKYTLQASPIGDVLRDGRTVLEKDAAKNRARYRHLQLVDFLSCIGVPVRAMGPPEYALFLFHPQKGALTARHLGQARAVASLLGAAVAREEAERIIRRVQPHIFIGQLGSSLVHEINSALGSIINSIATLRLDSEKLLGAPSPQMDLWMRDEITRSIEDVSLGAQRISSLVRLYLGLGRREELAPTNLNEVIRQAVRLLEPQAQDNKVRILLQLDPDIPITMTIAARLEQVLINVMMNAIQQAYLLRGEGLLWISAAFEPADKELPIKIRFSDNGPGIHGQHLGRLGELGFSTKKGGTGLGLFISRGLSESLGGRIRVEETAILVGTTFLLELPLVVPSVEGASP